MQHIFAHRSTIRVFSALNSSLSSLLCIFPPLTADTTHISFLVVHISPFRPAPIYSKEDDYINRISTNARLFGFVPIVNPEQRVSPIAVHDVARAVQQIVLRAVNDGEVFELTGDQTLTVKQLVSRIFLMLHKDERVIPLGTDLGALVGAAFDRLPSAWRGSITSDSVKQAAYDLVSSGSSQFKTLKDLHIEPSSLDEGLLKVTKMHIEWGKTPPSLRGTDKGVGPSKWQPY